ncbi:hypothetical protein [uncultured Pantoea sp.]|uniref:transcriptional antitermination N peptide n=1 Tax=uncultured Pantoea sp. TaxID=218084 RepID=UPI0025F454DA|nr:hypothetical protein [uncultured Pantoea sp.]
MANISYGRSVRSFLKDNSRTRRHFRRMLEAFDSRENQDIVAVQPEREMPLHKVIQNHNAIAPPLSRVEKALAIQPSKCCASIDNCCLPQVAFFHAGYRARQTKKAK